MRPKINFDNIEPICNLTKIECQEIIREHIICASGGLAPISTAQFFLQKPGILELYQSIKFFTSDKLSWPERIFEIYKPHERTQCVVCSNRPSFINFVKGYNKYCCRECYNTEVFKYFSEEIKDKRSRNRSVAASKRKGVPLTAEWKSKLKIAAQKETVKSQKRSTCFARYGVENPGVLGAFNSKAANDFILEYLIDNKINTNRCMFYNGSDGEFFQMVSVPFSNKKRYVSYDLVIFETEQDKLDKNLTAIEEILEYHGPWHYRKEDIVGKENEMATPYKNCKITKEQQIQLDYAKIEKAVEISKKVKIFWERDKTWDIF